MAIDRIPNRTELKLGGPERSPWSDTHLSQLMAIAATKTQRVMDHRFYEVISLALLSWFLKDSHIPTTSKGYTARHLYRCCCTSTVP